MQKTMLMTFSGEKKENDGRDNCMEELRLSKFMAGWNERRNVGLILDFKLSLPQHALDMVACPVLKSQR